MASSPTGMVDLNLTALISSVERDIWLLEQLESNSSRRRHLNSDELPFPITEELLKLPGFKPRQLSNSPTEIPNSSSKDANGSHSSSNNLLPPILPPKRRQENPSPKLGDLIHQRLLPRENCVTNILYSRRLPSPPVYRRPAPSTGQPHNFSQDDHFREKKVEDGDDAPQLFCPLCAHKFGYSFGLECHLLSVHREDLSRHAAITSPHIDRCPKCRAQFLQEGVLVKHLITSHKEFIVQSLLLEDDLQSKRYLECRFCGQHFMRRHLKLFTIHVEQKHESDLQKFLYSEATRFLPPDGDGIEDLTTEVALTLSLLRTVSFPPSKWSLLNNTENDGKKIKTEGHQTQTLASSIRRKRSSSQPVTRTLPRMPSAKQSLEDDHQFIPGEQRLKELHIRPRESSRIEKPDMKSTQMAFHLQKNLEAETAAKGPTFLKCTEPEPTQMAFHLQKNLESESRRTARPTNKSEEKSILLLPQQHQPQQQQPQLPRDVNSNQTKVKLGQLNHRRLLLPTYRHVPQPEPPPPASPVYFGSEDEDRRTTSSCYASSSSEGSSVDLDLWASVLSKTVDNLFKCNLCEMSFAENAFLLTHLKNRHRSSMTRALKPQFSCGACPAKFFKNSFLIKHCEHHLNSEKRRN